MAKRQGLMAVCILVGLFFSALAGGAELEGISLRWENVDRPDAKDLPDLARLLGRRIQIVPLQDARKDPALIGEDRRKPKHVRRVTTSDDVPAWCAKHLGEELTRMGASVVEDGGDFLLGGELRKFFAVEHGFYDAEVIVRLHLKDREGHELWTGLLAGNAGTGGLKYSRENFCEVFTSGVIDVAIQLVSNEEFLEALAPGPSSPR